MHKTLSLVVVLSLGSLAGQAQTTPAARRPDTAATDQRRAQHYTGPKVLDNTKELGQKFRRHSKPADGTPRVLHLNQSVPPKMKP